MAGRLLLAGGEGRDRDALAETLAEMGWTVEPCDPELALPEGNDALVVIAGPGGDVARLEADVTQPVALLRRFVAAGSGSRSVALLVIIGPAHGEGIAEPGLLESAVPGLARAAAPRARVNAVRIVSYRTSTFPVALSEALTLLLGNHAMTGQTIRLDGHSASGDTFCGGERGTFTGPARHEDDI